MQQQAFDTYASTYDAHFTHSSIGIMQRKRVYYFLKKYLSNKEAILELNCGTGEDARYFLENTHSYFGTDISEGMIEVAKEKNKNFTQNFITLNCLQVEELPQSDFTLVFSNFGGLNCLSKNELSALSKSLTNKTSNNALLAFVIMGNNCIWENFYFKKIKSKLYKRRQTKDGVLAKIDNQEFKTYYYSPSEIEELFKDEFEFLDAKPIGLFIPPSYLNYFFKARLFLLSCLYFLEKLFANFSFQSNQADHYIIFLRKK